MRTNTGISTHPTPCQSAGAGCHATPGAAHTQLEAVGTAYDASSAASIASTHASTRTLSMSMSALLLLMAQARAGCSPLRITAPASALHVPRRNGRPRTCPTHAAGSRASGLPRHSCRAVMRTSTTSTPSSRVSKGFPAQESARSAGLQPRSHRPLLICHHRHQSSSAFCFSTRSSPTFPSPRG